MFLYISGYLAVILLIHLYNTKVEKPKIDLITAMFFGLLSWAGIGLMVLIAIFIAIDEMAIDSDINAWFRGEKDFNDISDENEKENND